MSPKWCPGSAGLRQPKPELFACPECGGEVEIWNDEASRRCRSCGHDVFRSGTQSCLDWCSLAKECVGEEKYKQYGEMKASLRKQALLKAMEDYFAGDTRRIRHAKSVMAHAERILAEENDADPNIVIAAAILHDIGIKNAEAKHGSSPAKYQEIEGPPVAREILCTLEYPEEFIAEVCDIVAHHHHPRPEETDNFKVLYDADLLTNIEESAPAGGSSAGSASPSHRFFTEAAARISNPPQLASPERR